MLKKLTALLLALVLVVGTMSTAFAWSCPSCGNEMNGKFCTECGTKKPENICPACGTNYGEKTYAFCMECGTKLGASATAAPTAEPTSTPAPTAAPTATPTATPTAAPTAEPTATPVAEPEIMAIYENDNGSVSVLWETDGETTYQIRYALKQSDDVQADLTAANSLGYWVAKSDIGFFTISKMVPGQDYWIGVFDPEGRGHYEPFSPKEKTVENFSAFDAYVYMLQAIRVGEEDSYVDSFSAADIMAGGDEKYGLYLAIMYDNPGEEQELVLRVAMEAPNGAAYVPVATYATFKANTEDGIGWRFYDLSEHFTLMTDYFGTLPLGEYKVSAYLEGKAVGTKSFYVTEQAAATATPAAAPATAPAATPTAVPAPEKQGVTFTENDNGSVTVAWDADGTTNYRLQYIRKLSDDPVADKENPVSLGMWYSESTTSPYTISRLMPGVSYWIGVFDAQGKGEYMVYEPKTAVETFEAVETEMYLDAVIQADGNKVLATAFSVDDFEAEGNACGLNTYFRYNNPGDAKECLFQLAIQAPNGAWRVVYVTNVTLKAGTEDKIGWNFLDLKNYCEVMEYYSGSMPVGQYRVAMFLDGEMVGIRNFEVIEPVAKSSISITSVKYNDNGTVLVYWTDNGHGPYEVNYVECWSDDFEADKENARTSAYWNQAKDLTQNFCNMEYLVPGLTYWVVIKDSNGDSCRARINAPSVEPSDLQMTITSNPRMRKGAQLTEYAAFSALALNNDYSEEYGLYIKMNYDSITAKTQKSYQVFITLPNGVSFCTQAGDINLYAEGETYIEFFELDWFFGKVKEWNGSVLRGKYTVDVYIEGKLSGSTTFQVTKEGAAYKSGIVIEGVSTNKDGSVTVRWSDEFNDGPYTIEYGQKTGDDFYADNSGETCAIIFYDTKEATGGSHTLNYIIPGQPQWIAVYNAQGKGEHVAYESKAEKFSEFGVKMNVKLKTRKGESTQDVTRFSASEIAEGIKTFGAYVEVSYPQLARVRNYRLRMAITAPNGSVVAESCSDVELIRGKASSFSWDFYDFSWYFDTLIRNFGSVPMGEYTMTLYFDNTVVTTANFTVIN